MNFVSFVNEFDASAPQGGLEHRARERISRWRDLISVIKWRTWRFKSALIGKANDAI
jgi:hypothetical protein